MVLIAGPWVSSAIGNQFNLVAGTLANGIDKGSWETDGTGGGDGSLTDADIVDPVHGMAFAVYSADDHSLMFYKRKGLPKVGDMLNSRRVTAVYTGFEENSYNGSVNWHQSEFPHINNGDTNTPWYEFHEDIIKVEVVDFGIRPTNMGFWFQRFYALKILNIDKFDMSRNTSWQHTFWMCKSLDDLDLSRLNVNGFYAIESMCAVCTNLKTLNLRSWKGTTGCINLLVARCPNLTTLNLGDIDISNCGSFEQMFYGCSNLKYDCSDWNVSASALHDNFNVNASGVIAPTVWTAK